MNLLYSIHDSHPAERLSYSVFGIVALAIGLWLIQKLWPLVLIHHADLFRVGVAVILIIAGLWALIMIPQATLKAYRRRLVISYGIWPVSIFRSTRIPNDDIIQVKAVGHDPIDFPVGWGIRGQRARSSSQWTLRGSEFGKGVFISSTRGSWVIGCRNPEDAAARLRKIVGLE